VIQCKSLSQYKFEDTKRPIRLVNRRKKQEAIQWPKEKGKNYKQLSTIHYTES
jgi:hypothetical protein